MHSFNSYAQLLISTFRHSDMQIAQLSRDTWMDARVAETTPFPELHCALNEKEKQMMLHINSHFFLH